MSRNIKQACPVVLMGLVAATWFLVGCESVQIRERPEGWQPFTGVSVDENRNTRPVGFFKSLRLTIDEAERTPSNEFVSRIRNSFRETNLFLEVSLEKPAVTYPQVELSLKVTDQLTENRGANAIKAFLSGLTLFLLSPILPQYADLTCEMRLIVVRSDGKSKEYVARTSGTATAGIDLRAQKYELWSKATSSNLNSIMSQMIADEEFYKLTSPRAGKAGLRPT